MSERRERQRAEKESEDGEKETLQAADEPQQRPSSGEATAATGSRRASAAADQQQTSYSGLAPAPAAELADTRSIKLDFLFSASQSPTMCNQCSALKARITEARIYNLYAIREDEIHIDSLATASQIMDATGGGLGSPAPRLLPAADKDRWSGLGVNPKPPACCTPIAPAPWFTVPTGRRRGRRTDRPLPRETLILANGFQALGDRVSPARPRGSPAASQPVNDARARPSRNIVRENPRGGRPAAQPSTLVVGSSMVRHVSLEATETLCYPGARVTDITSSIAPAMREFPTASTAIVHVGSNDIRLQQSQKLVDDFETLIHTVLDTGKRCVVSGPIPSPCFGDVNFSRLRQLHIWLKAYCCVLKIPYVDNFGTFWQRRELFGRDRRHLNGRGASLLACNMDLALQATRSTSK